IGIKSHFSNHTDQYLSSASVKKNKLLTDGAEIIILVSKDKLLVGKTLAVQEFEEFSKRDFGRPVRDMQSGVMPPKLARMMINIATGTHDKTILDPFCGSGTVLQEAVLLRYTNLYGTDNSEKAIEDSKINVEWLKKRFSDLPINIHIEKYDVRKLSGLFSTETIDAIITEPYLGPNFKTHPHFKDILLIQEELKKLYLSAFKEFAKILKQNGTVLMIFPVFNVNKMYS